MVTDIVKFWYVKFSMNLVFNTRGSVTSQECILSCFWFLQYHLAPYVYFPWTHTLLAKKEAKSFTQSILLVWEAFCFFFSHFPSVLSNEYFSSFFRYHAWCWKMMMNKSMLSWSLKLVFRTLTYLLFCMQMCGHFGRLAVRAADPQNSTCWGSFTLWKYRLCLCITFLTLFFSPTHMVFPVYLWFVSCRIRNDDLIFSLP